MNRRRLIVLVMVVVVMYFNWQRQQSVLVDLLIATSLGLTVVSAADYFLRVRKIVDAPAKS